MFCVTNWITTPSKARNCLFFFFFSSFFFFFHPSCSSGCNPLCRALVGHRGAHTHLWVIHLICSPLPTRIITTRRDGNETSPFPSFKKHVGDFVRRWREILSSPSFECCSSLLSGAPPPPTPRLLPGLTLIKIKKSCFDSSCACFFFNSQSCVRSVYACARLAEEIRD